MYLGSADLYSKTKRLVPDSEIGMAALICSIDRHCNPYHTFSDDEPLPPRIPTQSQNPDRNTVIVPGTQEMETQLSNVGGESSNRLSVDETILEQNSSKNDDVKVKSEPMSVPKKEEPEDEPPSKKRCES